MNRARKKRTGKEVVRVFRVKLPKRVSDNFKSLIENGTYVTYADAIRHAIELLLKEQKTKIMVVDDEPDFVYTTKTMLRREGYKVIEAYSGEECLHKLEEKPNLILLDIMMPGIDGWEVCRRIKRDKATSAIPVIILSVRQEEKDIRRSFEYAHADEHLTKPINISELTNVIEGLISIT